MDYWKFWVISGLHPINYLEDSLLSLGREFFPFFIYLLSPDGGTREHFKLLLQEVSISLSLNNCRNQVWETRRVALRGGLNAPDWVLQVSAHCFHLLTGSGNRCLLQSQMPGSNPSSAALTYHSCAISSSVLCGSFDVRVPSKGVKSTQGNYISSSAWPRIRLLESRPMSLGQDGTECDLWHREAAAAFFPVVRLDLLCVIFELCLVLVGAKHPNWHFPHLSLYVSSNNW